MSVLAAAVFALLLGAAAYTITRAIQRHHAPQQPDPRWGVDGQLLNECQQIADAGTANRRNTRGTRP